MAVDRGGCEGGVQEDVHRDEVDHLQSDQHGHDRSNRPLQSDPHPVPSRLAHSRRSEGCNRRAGPKWARHGPSGRAEAFRVARSRDNSRALTGPDGLTRQRQASHGGGVDSVPLARLTMESRSHREETTMKRSWTRVALLIGTIATTQTPMDARAETASGAEAIRPFSVNFPEEALADLKRRIAATR